MTVYDEEDVTITSKNADELGENSMAYHPPCSSRAGCDLSIRTWCAAKPRKRRSSTCASRTSVDQSREKCRGYPDALSAIAALKSSVQLGTGR